MKPRTRWIILLPALFVALAGVGATALWLWRDHGDAQLLSTEADTIPGRAHLAAYARARAAPIYRRACARCHGVDLTGDRRLGVPDLTDHDWLYGEGRVSEIEQTLTHGVRSGDPKGRNLADMPAYGRPEPYARYHIPPLSPGDIRDLTDYLLTLESRAADPTASARGDTIFHTRGGCYDCHGADAHGDGAIGAPNLRDRIWLYGDGSRDAIFQTIAEGRAGICPAWYGRLTAAEIRALAVFVHDHGRRSGGA